MYYHSFVFLETEFNNCIYLKNVTSGLYNILFLRNALNPADIVQLHRLYNTSDPPPVELLRIPQFLQLLIDALFKPGAKINQVNFCYQNHSLLSNISK